MVANFSWLVRDEIAGSAAPRSPEDIAELRQLGVCALVRMADDPIAHRLAQDITLEGLEDCHEPVPDFTAPTVSQIKRMVSFIQQCLSQGKPVAVSCGAGFGRTGTILACYLVSKGRSADAAILEVRRKRPGSIETAGQERAVRDYEKIVRSGGV
jgi:atypical dual specificity phosphatase